MVLQRNVEIRIWGRATPQEKIEVALGPNIAYATTNNRGQWDLVLPAMEAGGPFKMIVKGQNTIEFKNIMIGEVWICSGQLDIEFAVPSSIKLSKPDRLINFKGIIRRKVYHLKG